MRSFMHTFMLTSVFFVPIVTVSRGESNQSLPKEEQLRLLEKIRAVYESNVSKFDVCKFRFLYERINSFDENEYKRKLVVGGNVAKGEYNFDADSWKYVRLFSEDAMRSDAKIIPTGEGNNKSFRIRTTLPPVEVVSDGRVLIERRHYFDPVTRTGKTQSQVWPGGMVGYHGWTPFPLDLGKSEKSSGNILEDIDESRNGGKARFIDLSRATYEGTPVLRVQFSIDPEITRTYLIDLDRGGIPLLTSHSMLLPDGKKYEQVSCNFDIRKIDNDAWFPFGWYEVSNGDASIMTIVDAKVGVPLTEAETSIRFTMPQKLPGLISGEKHLIWKPESIKNNDLTALRNLLKPSENLNLRLNAQEPTSFSWTLLSNDYFRIIAALSIVLTIVFFVFRIGGKSSQIRGFTLIEVLVVISIIGILTALVLPFLRSARESSRRALCTNNIKQVLLALNQYEQAFGSYPGMHYRANTGGSIESSVRKYSIHSRLLPFMEQAELFSSINFSFYQATENALASNLTAMERSVSSFLCPSDRVRHRSQLGTNNYRFNNGPGPQSGHDSAYFRSGAFEIARCVSPAMVTDGLSSTVAASERVQGSWDVSNPDPFADYKTVNRFIYPDRVYDVDRAYRLCLGLDRFDTFETRSGETWLYVGLHSTLYNHIYVPNFPVSDCSYRGDHSTFSARQLIVDGPMSARSYHSGGVNTGFLDGHIGFIRAGVELSVWRAISTRNQGEAIPANSF